MQNLRTTLWTLALCGVLSGRTPTAGADGQDPEGFRVHGRQGRMIAASGGPLVIEGSLPDADSVYVEIGEADSRRLVLSRGTCLLAVRTSAATIQPAERQVVVEALRAKVAECCEGPFRVESLGRIWVIEVGGAVDCVRVLDAVFHPDRVRLAVRIPVEDEGAASELGTDGASRPRPPRAVPAGILREAISRYRAGSTHRRPNDLDVPGARLVARRRCEPLGEEDFAVIRRLEEDDLPDFAVAEWLSEEGGSRGRIRLESEATNWLAAARAQDPGCEPLLVVEDEWLGRIFRDPAPGVESVWVEPRTALWPHPVKRLRALLARRSYGELVCELVAQRTRGGNVLLARPVVPGSATLVRVVVDAASADVRRMEFAVECTDEITSQPSAIRSAMSALPGLLSKGAHAADGALPVEASAPPLAQMGAVLAAERAPSATHIRSVAAATLSRDLTVRSLAHRSLFELGGRQAEQAVRALRGCRGRAAAALMSGLAYHKRDVYGLSTELKNRALGVDTNEAVFAIRAYSKLMGVDPWIPDRLGDLLQSPVAGARGEAAVAVGLLSLRSPALIAKMEELLGDGQLKAVRRRAAAALLRLGHSSRDASRIMRELERRAGDRDAWLVKWARGED